MPVELNEQEIAAIQGGDLSILKPVLDLGLNVRTTQQQQEYEANLISQAVRKHDSSTYSHIDTMVADVTGMERQPNEKTADYVSRVMPAFKEQQTRLNSELAELKEKRTDEGLSSEEKKRLSTLEKMLKEQNEKMEALEKDKVEAVKGVEVKYTRAAAEKDLLSRKYKIEKEYVSDVVNSRLNKFYNENDVTIGEDGTPMVVNKKTGEPELDKTTLKPVTPVAVMERYVSDLIDNSTPPKGSGTSPDGKKTEGGAPEERKGDYSGITTRMALMEQMGKDGYVQNTPEFDKVYMEVRAEYKKMNGVDMPLGKSGK